MAVIPEVFPLTRIINLADRTDRRHEMERQLEALGAKVTPGKVEFFSASRPTEAAGFPNIGTRGCFLSHLAILKDAQARGVASVLILEDDLEVHPSDLPKLGALIGLAAKQPWQILHLGHILPLPPAAAPELVPGVGAIRNAHCYAIHSSIFTPLIEYLEGCLVRPPGDPIGGPMHYDGALTMFRQANPSVITLVANPSVAGQRSSRSDITFRRIETVPGIRQALSLARKLKRLVRP